MVSRRNFTRTLGLAAGSAAVGGIGVSAFSENASAADASLESLSPTLEATTDDGKIKYVSYGGKLHFKWDGLDTEATHAGYNVKVRLHTERSNDYDGDDWTAWRDFGTGTGKLGDDSGSYDQGETGGWGGENDSNSGPGTEGFFQFKFGDMYGNTDYAIATDGGDYGLLMGANTFPIDAFASKTDGEEHRSVVQIKKTCFVMDGEDGQRLVEDEATGSFEVIVGNRARVGTTDGKIKGSVGADES